jgi:REP element-mobilizing transposase RayT
MPRFGFLWRHVIISTKSSWLHGDKRGFRSRKHRIHSSGDYKNPPPPQEHEGLHEFHKKRSRTEVHIPEEKRAIIGRAFLRELELQGYLVLAMAVAKVHLHALLEAPHEISEVKKIIGEAKRTSSRMVCESIPGGVWGEGGKFKPVMDKKHCESGHDYIIYEQGPTAWTWSFRDHSREGKFNRVRPKRSHRKGTGR